MDDSSSINLRLWVRELPLRDQEIYFRQAARFFSNRELTEIIGYLRNNLSLFRAHEKAGVFGRYAVDLEHLRSSWNDSNG